MPRRILIVEDEASLAALVRDYLETDGFSADIEPDGPSGLAAALSGAYELAILDLMLPGLDGFELVRGIRAKSDMPLIILSARRDDGDKIRGLGLGADDYVTKPFSPGELLARVKSQLARYSRLTGKAGSGGDAWLRDGEIAFNPVLRLATLKGEELRLTGKEFDLLSLFMQNPRRVFSKDELYERLWGAEDFRDTGTVSVCVHRLREKIEADPAKPRRLETVWGMGYRWRPGEA